MKDKTTKTEKDWVFNLAYNKALCDVEKMIEGLKVWEPCGDRHSQKKLAEDFKLELKSKLKEMKK